MVNKNATRPAESSQEITTEVISLAESFVADFQRSSFSWKLSRLRDFKTHCVGKVSKVVQQNQTDVSDFEHTPKSQHFMIFEYCSLCRYDMIMTMIQMRREGCVYDFKMRMCCFYDEVERWGGSLCQREREGRKQSYQGREGGFSWGAKKGKKGKKWEQFDQCEPPHGASNDADDCLLASLCIIFMLKRPYFASLQNTPGSAFPS